MTKIVVHNGKAHQDDFLAACVCAYKLDAPIFRCSPTEKDLTDPNVWVLDQGGDFNCSLHNFDHHQIEEKICSFTMILDYFYNNDFREYLPYLRFLEIYDSYGPKPAADFAEMKIDSLDFVTSPIHLCMVRIFSKIEGEVYDPIYSVMKSIGEEICNQIESIEELLDTLEESEFFDYSKYRILDVTKCIPPEGYRFDQLPTKIYCKVKKEHADIILTPDSRNPENFRMISTNLDVARFKKNEISEFTHNSGFLTTFNDYSKFSYILDNFTI